MNCMHATVLQQLRCPVCGAEFHCVAGGVACRAGHRFDFARQGYLNLRSHISRRIR